ncbi:hypothetical protein V5799_015749, partial [Amblyomma americanum]
MLDVFCKCHFTGLVAWLLSGLLRYLWDLALGNKRRGLPPGPRGMPLLGYLPFMPNDGHRGIERLRQKYSNVFGTVIDIHVETYKEGVVRDYIGAFLGEKEIPSR